MVGRQPEWSQCIGAPRIGEPGVGIASQTENGEERAGGVECRRLLPLWVGGARLSVWRRCVMEDGARQHGIDGSE